RGGRGAVLLRGESVVHVCVGARLAVAGLVRHLVQAASCGVDRRGFEQPAAWAHERAAIELRSQGASQLDLESVTRPVVLTCRVRVADYGFWLELPSGDPQTESGGRESGPNVETNRLIRDERGWLRLAVSRRKDW